MNKKVWCPVNGWDCPYYKNDGLCIIEDPLHNCDDFAFFWDEGDDFYDDTHDDGYYFEDDDCGFDPYLGCYTDDC